MKVFIHSVPKTFQPHQLALMPVSETFWKILRITKRHSTPCFKDSDLAFIPINLIELQFKNIDPKSFLESLPVGNKPHFIVALGDFSNRSKAVHNGAAYKHLYTWLSNIRLLALESTDDLIADFDVGIVPYNCVKTHATSPSRSQPIFCDFYGTINHTFLPDSHLRSRIGELSGGRIRICEAPDTFGRNTALLAKTLKKLRLTELSTSLADHPFRRRGEESIFTLCPPGYGSWTYRYFLTIRYGGIPVRWGGNWQPGFSDLLPYSEAEVLIKEDDFINTESILASLSSA